MTATRGEAGAEWADPVWELWAAAEGEEAEGVE